MPASTRKRNLPSVLNIDKFEPLSKNKVSLGNDEQLSIDYVPLKVGTTILPIEFKKGNVRINGDLEFPGSLSLNQLKTDLKYFEHTTGLLGYHRFNAQGSAANFDLWVLVGNTYMLNSSALHTWIGLTSIWTLAEADMTASPVVMRELVEIQAPSTTNTKLSMYRTGDKDDKVILKIMDEGAFSITASGDSTDDGYIELKNDSGTLATFNSTDLTLTGDITLSGGSVNIIEAADHPVTPIASYGQLWVKTATPNQLYFTTDAGDDIQLTSGTGTAGGGASALDELSDVSYSSGDLEITSLDRIKFPSTTSTTLELKGKLLFRDFGSGDAGYDFLEIDEDGHNIIMDNDTTQLEFKCWSSVASVSSNTALKLYSNTGDIHFNGNQNNIKFDSGGVGAPQTEIEFDLFYIDGLAIFTKQVIYNPNDRNDYFEIKIAAEGATTLTTHDQDTTSAHLELAADGKIILDAHDQIDLEAYTSINFQVGIVDIAEITSTGIHSNKIIYFNTETANTCDSSGGAASCTISWTANQKQSLTLIGTANTVNFNPNPTGPCNLMLKVIQGDGSDTVTSWDSDIKWPSGTPPVLSTGSGEIDIISFYFDGANYFGVGSLDFS